MKFSWTGSGHDRATRADRFLRPSRWELMAILLVLVIGVILRGLYLGELREMPELNHPPVDEGFNLYWARGLATADWALPPDAWGRDPGIRTTAYSRPPGYAFVLAGIFRLVGGEALGLRVVQMGLGLVSVVLAWLIGRRLLGPVVGVVWAALMVLNWPLLYFQGGLNGAWLLVLLSLVLTVLLFRLAKQPNWPWAASAGAVLGLLALVRPNALLFAPVLVVWGWWVVRRRRLTNRFWPMAVAAAVVGAVVLTPTALRNWRVEGTFALVSANGGLTLYHANNEDAAGFSTSCAGGLGVMSSPWVIPDFIARMEMELGRDLTFGETSKIFGGRALAWMIDNPGREMVLIGRRAALFWGPDEVAHNHVVGADRAQSPLLRMIPVGFPTALGGALVGLAVLVVWWRRDAHSGFLRDKGTLETLVALGLFVMTWFVSFLPFSAASLYRVPVLPFLLLGSAVALVEVGRSIQRRRRAFWGWLGALVVAVGLTHIPIVSAEVGMARWYYDRGLAWIYEAQPERAAESFRRALAENPSHAPAHNGVGKVLLESGDLAGALRHFSQAAALKPKDPVARSNSGLVLARMGRWFEAEEAFMAALKWAPTNADSWANVGICRERMGNRSDVVVAYESALALDGGHRSVANNLAWLLATAPEQELRDGEYAVVLAERVVASGASASTLDTLAAAYAEAGRYSEAVVAAERALAELGDRRNPFALEVETRLRSYRQGRPYRQPSPGTTAHKNPGG
ncbi:MAG: glycosyltransferase family 39 protein [Thermoanaerobaculales bacterium]|nr:glycosyltransferase family 39 protein [Thermoanaerobaculales bacterium]